MGTNNIDSKMVKQHEKKKASSYSDPNENVLEKQITASGKGSELLVSN